MSKMKRFYRSGRKSEKVVRKALKSFIKDRPELNVIKSFIKDGMERYYPVVSAESD